MTRQFWINLPVKDVSKSKAFFATLGFGFNPRFAEIGDKEVVVMLFLSSTFDQMTKQFGGNSSQGGGVLLSFDAESKEEVDELAIKITHAGGKIISPPTSIQGWMYGCTFEDLDGHRWNILFMDTAKTPIN
jgi:predicted lactoylglutathione lyase